MRFIGPRLPSGDRCGPAGGGLVVEVHAGSLHATDLQQPLQRPLRPGRHWSRNRALWALWLLRHLQGAPLDVEIGQSLSFCFFFVWIHLTNLTPDVDLWKIELNSHCKNVAV